MKKIFPFFRKKQLLDMIEINGIGIEVSKKLVTQKIWSEVMGKNNSFFEEESNPVESISYVEALKFCNILSEKEKLKPVYSEEYIKKFEKPSTDSLIGLMLGDLVKIDFQNTEGYRLPTEEEWNYFLGNFNIGKINDISWNATNSDGKVQKVGEKEANEFGIFDTIGNVWELCADGIAKGYCYSDNLSFITVAQIKEAQIKNTDYEEIIKGSKKIGFRVVKNLKKGAGI